MLAIGNDTRWHRGRSSANLWSGWRGIAVQQRGERHPMCRLFPPELIDTIAMGETPDPHALDRIAAHIESDLRTLGGAGGLWHGAAFPACRTLAVAALTWPDERPVANPSALAA